MSSKQTSYRSIFKATSIFGGVQVINIIITIIRGKALALLIGTAGMGLNGLLMAGLNIIKALTSLGISESAVRDISISHASGNEEEIATTYTVFKRWIWFTALLGVLVTISLSTVLSKAAFGNSDHAMSYVWLSITFIFGALVGGIYTFLRGTRQVKYLAQATIYGSIAGLIVALPIFYVYGINGVVPAIIATSFVTFLVSLYFKRKIKIKTVEISWADTFTKGKPMVVLGLSMSVSTLLASGVAFVLSTFIVKLGSLEDLGLYNAGGTIVSSYVGMVFTAMSMDYFPRLSGLIHDEVKWKELVNQQADLVIIILNSVLILLLATAPLLIKILLSSEFLGALDYIMWAVIAIPLRGLVWVLGFIFIAKGDNKLFVIVETGANLLVLSFNLLFYYNFGLIGLGISMLVSYVISSIVMILIVKNKYNFSFSKEAYRLTIFVLISLLVCLFFIKLLGYPYAYISSSIIVLLTVSYNLYELNKRMNLKEIVATIKSKIKK